MKKSCPWLCPPLPLRYRVFSLAWAPKDYQLLFRHCQLVLGNPHLSPLVTHPHLDLLRPPAWFIKCTHSVPVNESAAAPPPRPCFLSPHPVGIPTASYPQHQSPSHTPSAVVWGGLLRTPAHVMCCPFPPGNSSAVSFRITDHPLPQGCGDTGFQVQSPASDLFPSGSFFHLLHSSQ